MQNGLYRIGLALCDELDCLAAMTRVRRIKTSDLTSATIAVRSERLRASLERRFVYGGAEPRLADAIEAIVEVVTMWRERSGERGPADELADLVSERGTLLVRLLRNGIEVSVA